MNKLELSKQLSSIDDIYIEEANPQKTNSKNSKRKTVYTAIISASAAVILLSILLTSVFFSPKNPHNGSSDVILMDCTYLVMNDSCEFELETDYYFQATISELSESKFGYMNNPFTNGLFVIDCTKKDSLENLIRGMSAEKEVLVFSYYDRILLVDCTSGQITVELMPEEYNPYMFDLHSLTKYMHIDEESLAFDDICAYFAFSEDNLQYYLEYYGVEVDTVMLSAQITLDSFFDLLNDICRSINVINI